MVQIGSYACISVAISPSPTCMHSVENGAIPGIYAIATIIKETMAWLMKLIHVVFFSFKILLMLVLVIIESV